MYILASKMKTTFIPIEAFISTDTLSMRSNQLKSKFSLLHYWTLLGYYGIFLPFKPAVNENPGSGIAIVHNRFQKVSDFVL